MTAVHQPRQCERLALRGDIALRRSFGARHDVQIQDFSPHGCRVDLVERVQTGERLWVSFPGIETIEAKARWSDGFIGGVSFVRPLHPAVFDMLATRIAAAAA